MKRMLLAFPSLNNVLKYLPKRYNKLSVTITVLHDKKLSFHSFFNLLGLVNDMGVIIVL